MSVKHYKPATASERAALKKQAAAKKSSKRSTPAKTPVSKTKLRSAGASLRKAVNRKKK